MVKMWYVIINIYFRVAAQFLNRKVSQYASLLFAQITQQAAKQSRRLRSNDFVEERERYERQKYA